MSELIAVFDLGGTWFRWGRYSRSTGLFGCERVPAINHLSHSHLSAEELQHALTEFVIERTREMSALQPQDLRVVSVSIGAPVNVHDRSVLGSGPLWGPTARPFQLQSRLRAALPELEWHVLNDVTALLTQYMDADTRFTKTLLITVSSGVGSRLYDHRTRRIPFDTSHGIQGEIGHLPYTFELHGRLLNRQCECGGWNHVNAFASGRGVTQILKTLPTISSKFDSLFSETPLDWERAADEHRLGAFEAQLNSGNPAALDLLDHFVSPLSRTLVTLLSLDPDVDRIIITGGVAQGLGQHYREALQRLFLREGLYQISDRDPHYLLRRLHWDDADDLGGLRGAGLYARMSSTTNKERKQI